ncbi:MAG: OB-fold nucleic acid binding domain-containing protein [Clostridiales bacterium]|nr:OB-fold nucleic acid binding domain-containing protein [Clostridiales bacterium]MDD7347513.1 OB-fold nucleic acid binding domain-containing protein [Clostridiales bacterium]MDY4061259.1 OB-fold nucleic acid binding domain-containing protein [Anaerovoracaceae bacterium]
MKKIYISDLQEGQEFIDFFIVRASGIKIGSNGKKYLDISMGDRTGDLTAKKWDVSPSEEPALEAIKPGDIVKIKASVTVYRDAKQLRVTRIRQVKPEDGVNAMDLVKSAPESGESMFNYILNRAEEMHDEEFKAMSTTVLLRNKERLLYYPAAMRNHHAELAGLLWHMKRMIMHAEVLVNVYTILNRDLLVAGVIFHDIEKLTEINSNKLGVSDGYTFEGRLLGHLVQGVKVIDTLAEELGISQEKSIMLQHMSISHHYEADFGSPKKPLFPEAEMLHYLDIMDAKMYDMEEAISKTKPGEFSDRIWSMDNRTIYRATFGSDRTKVPKESVASGELTESTEPEDESVEMQQVLWNL